jgi:hypothetical protein
VIAGLAGCDRWPRLTDPPASSTFALDGPMASGRTRPRLLALLLMPVLLVVGLGRAQAFYLCKGDQVARTSCCCPRAATAPDDGEAPSRWGKPSSCCSIEERGAPAPASRSAEPGAAPSPEVPAIAIAAQALPPPRPALIVAVPRRTLAPPRTASRPSQHVALLL